jgi:REP element-mobilizing transposase RayT
MARPLRIEYQGAHHHVTTRGNERKAIFRDDQDRERFLELLGRTVEQFDVRLHAYVLMDNHYHLLIETRRAGLNQAMRYLNGVYTQAFNRRHKRVGHLFQGRYKAILVEEEPYLLELSRYIHLNPWRVKQSIDPIKYPWSSLGSYVGTRAVPGWLTVKEVLSQFGSTGKRGYREFVTEGVKEGIGTPWEDVRGQAVLGSEDFIERVVSKHVGRKGNKAEVARRRELAGVRPQAILLAVERYFKLQPGEIKGRQQKYTEARYVASYVMRRHGMMGLREIGERVGLHLSAVGNAVTRVSREPTRAMAQAVKAIENTLKNQAMGSGLDLLL